MCIDRFASLVETVNKYSRKAAIVQTGIKTQVVSALAPFPLQYIYFKS